MLNRLAVCCCASLIPSAGIAAESPILYVANGSTITAFDLGTRSVIWVGSPGGQITDRMIIVPDGPRAVLFCEVGPTLVAIDASTGAGLWSTPGSLQLGEGALDAQGQAFTNPVRYPMGAPRQRFDAAPDVLIAQGSGAVTTILADSRTGAVHWSHAEPTQTHGYGFLPVGPASYDVLMRTLTGDMMRIDGQTGAQVVWSRSLTHRSALPVGDITGDGVFDLFTRANYSSDMIWLDGETGATLDTVNFCAFDVLCATTVPGAGQNLVDVIATAQGSCDGGIRRINGQTGATVWTCSQTYNNQTLMGLIRRVGGGHTILSGWRATGRTVAVDADTGAALWDSVPNSDADFGTIGSPDVTGDGNDDVFSIASGMLRLYDGITGLVVSHFVPMSANNDGAAIWVRSPASPGPGLGECMVDANGDNVVDFDDITMIIANFNATCP